MATAGAICEIVGVGVGSGGLYLAAEIAWNRFFGRAKRAERSVARKYAEATEAVTAIFSAAERRMQRRTGTGNPFRLGK